MPEPSELLAVGWVVRPHGVRGELLLENLTHFPERLDAGDTVFLGEAAEPHTLTGVRQHRGQLLIRLADCASRDAADALRGQLVRIRAEAAGPLPPGQYYHHQIVGLHVVTDEGEHLGDVIDVLETGANDVYVVRTAEGEVLLPAIRSAIREIDLQEKRMTVHLLEGLR